MTLTIRILGVAAIAFGLLGAIAYTQLRRSDELQSKPEWSMLQDLEFRYREAQDLRPLIVEKQSDLCAAGILSKGQDTRVWILLNARFEPRVKVMPAASYEISTKDLAEISSKCEIGELVRTHLEAHLSDEP